MTDSPVSAPARGTAAEREERRALMGRRAREALLRGEPLTRAMVDPMDDDALHDLTFALGAVVRDANQMFAVAAAAESDRSDAKAKDVGFARRKGHRGVTDMIEAQAGVSGQEARRLIEVGETLADAERARAMAGEAPSGAQPTSDRPERPVFPHVANAVSLGELGTEAATAITRMLRRVGERCGGEELAEAEEKLVFSARFMNLSKLRQLINRYEARLDAAHLEELAESRRQRRFLHIGENADGMIRINGQLDPENGAPLVAVMGAMVNQHARLRKKALDAHKTGAVVEVDERTPEQVRADAMGDFARHLAGCDVDILPHTGVKVIVRMDYDALVDQAAQAGASIDGLSTVPDAGELRRFLARAGLIPHVLGGGSCTMDFGHERSQFTEKQKLALLARDGGCAKCGAPPSWCDAHHIIPVEFGGKTDIANGVMLCVRCHHDVHRDGWIIKATTTEVWFIPPVHLDPERTPQPGGRALFDAVPTPTELPDQADIIAQTPLAATKVGDWRRRDRGEPPAQRTLMCAREPSPSVSMLVAAEPRETPSGTPPRRARSTEPSRHGPPLPRRAGSPTAHREVKPAPRGGPPPGAPPTDPRLKRRPRVRLHRPATTVRVEAAALAHAPP